MRSATTSRGATWDLMQPCAHSSPNIYSPLIKYQHYKSISFKLIRAGPPLGGPALRARMSYIMDSDQNVLRKNFLTFFLLISADPSDLSHIQKINFPKKHTHFWFENEL